QGTLVAALHLDRALRGVGRANGRLLPQTGSGWVGRWLRDRSRAEGATSLWLRLGTARPPLLDALAGMLRDPDGDVRRAAAGAVGRLGAAATGPILDALAGMLRHPDGGARRAALEAVGGVGAAATGPILDALAGMLRHPDGGARRAALEAVGRLGAA